MSSKINIKNIIKEHIDTLRDFRNNQISKKDIITFFIFPLIISIYLIKLDIVIEHDMITVLITAFSLLGGLLFNLLILLYNMLNSTYKDNTQTKENSKMILLKEIYINVSFAILLSILLIILVIALGLMPKQNILFMPFNFIVYYLLGVFTLTLLMILKRMYILLEKEFKKPIDD